MRRIVLSGFVVLIVIGWMTAAGAAKPSIIITPGASIFQATTFKSTGNLLACPTNTKGYFEYVSKKLTTELIHKGIKVPAKVKLDAYRSKRFINLLKQHGIMDDDEFIDENHPKYRQLEAELNSSQQADKQIDYRLVISIEGATEINEVSGEGVEYSAMTMLKLIRVEHKGGGVLACEVASAEGEGLLFGDLDTSKSRRRLLCLDTAHEAALEALKIITPSLHGKEHCL